MTDKYYSNYFSQEKTNNVPKSELARSDFQNQEENEVLAHRFHMDMFQKRDLSAVDEILATDFVWRNPQIPSELTHGPENAKKIVSAVVIACPILELHTMKQFLKMIKL